MQGVAWVEPAACAPRAQQLLACLTDGMTAKRWALAAGCSLAEVSRHSRTLIAAGLVTVLGDERTGGRRARQYGQGRMRMDYTPSAAENAWYAARADVMRGEADSVVAALKARTLWEERAAAGEAPPALLWETPRWAPTHPHYRKLSAPVGERISWKECGERMIRGWAEGAWPWEAITVRDLWGWWRQCAEWQWPGAEVGAPWVKERTLVERIYGTRWPEEDTAWVWPWVIGEWWAEQGHQAPPSWEYFLSDAWTAARPAVSARVEAWKAQWRTDYAVVQWAERVADMPREGPAAEQAMVLAGVPTPPVRPLRDVAAWVGTHPDAVEDVKVLAGSVLQWQEAAEQSAVFDPGPGVTRADCETYCRRCPAQAVCVQAHRACGPYCLGWIQLSTLYGLAEIPRAYQLPAPLVVPPEDAAAWAVLEGIERGIADFVGEGRGLYLWSKTRGNGKTTWATRLARAWALKVALTNPGKCRVLYVNVTEGLERLRRAITTGESTVGWQRRIEHADLVIFDDIGTEKPSEWVQDTIYRWVNAREMHRRAVIYTSNVPLRALEPRLGERVVSRIAGQCTRVELTGPDRRWE